MCEATKTIVLTEAAADTGMAALSDELVPSLVSTEIGEPPVPWDSGRDRVVAMVVHPGRVFLYWEITDAALDRARAGIPDGESAGIVVRVHDVTGRIFDGGNSLEHIDCPVGRRQRQWFLDLDRPGADILVEVGLLSRSGAFSRMLRAERVNLPRRQAASSGAVRWLTVVEGDGQAGVVPMTWETGPTAALLSLAPQSNSPLGGSSDKVARPRGESR